MWTAPQHQLPPEGGPADPEAQRRGCGEAAPGGEKVTDLSQQDYAQLDIRSAVRVSNPNFIFAAFINNLAGSVHRMTQFHTIYNNVRQVITVTYFMKRKYLEVRLNKAKEGVKG